MSRKNFALSNADRRAMSATKHAYRIQWTALSARYDRGLLGPQVRRAQANAPAVLPRTAPTVAAPVRPVAKVPVSTGLHTTAVQAEGELFRAVCSCSWSSKPTRESSAKGAATRHRNSTAATLPMAA